MKSYFFVVAALACGLVGCPRRSDEPDLTPTPPTSATSSAKTSAPTVPSGPPAPAVTWHDPSSGDAGIAAPYTPSEEKLLHSRLGNEQCEMTAKHANQVNGRPDFDKKGSLVITGCLFQGNMAWYRCMMDTKTQKEIEWCGLKYMVPPDELNKKK